MIVVVIIAIILILVMAFELRKYKIACRVLETFCTENYRAPTSQEIKYYVKKVMDKRN